MFTGWDATVYVNEEVKGRRTNPGKSAVLAVVFLAVVFIMSEVGLQGVVSPARLQANSANALVYVAQALGGGGWAKVMALALALSVIATTLTGIVILARILYGMASYRALPGPLARVSCRLLHARYRQHPRRPDLRSAHLGILAVLRDRECLQRSDRLDWHSVCCLLCPHGAVRDRVLPAPRLHQHVGRRARRTSSRSPRTAFLAWMVEQAVVSAPASQNWTLVAILAIGVVLLLYGRFISRSNFYQLPRESAPRN